MQKGRIPTAKKFALWRAHGARCSYCRQPLRFSDAEVDHILPRKLETHPNELERIVREYGLPQDFNFEDYANWLPCHKGCNLLKGATVLERGQAHYFLSVARSRCGKAEEEEARLARGLKSDRLLGHLEIALQEGLVQEQQVVEVLQKMPPVTGKSYDPVVMTFGTNVSDLLEEEMLPDCVPTSYPELCDWLEDDLLARLGRTVRCSYYYTEGSARSGETLSVRLAFVGLDLNEFDKFDAAWWEILEVAYYSEIYGPAAAV